MRGALFLPIAMGSILDIGNIGAETTYKAIETKGSNNVGIAIETTKKGDKRLNAPNHIVCG